MDRVMQIKQETHQWEIIYNNQIIINNNSQIINYHLKVMNIKFLNQNVEYTNDNQLIPLFVIQK